jgi:serine/threonine protein phosphatase PrpC
MGHTLRCYGKTDVGRARQKNEDNFILVPAEGLYLVADGMGGHQSGELASQLAVSYITEFICILAKDEEYEWPYTGYSDRTRAENCTVVGIQYANERIFIESCKNRGNDGMGTTITALLETGEDLVVAHVGDSRVYRLRNGTLSQLTADHSLLNHMLDTGKLAPEDADSFPNKNVIFRALGLKDYVEVDTTVHRRVAGDIYLLCSDGLTDLVEDWVIADVIQDSVRDLERAATTLIRLANEAGGKDNITVLLAQVEDA